MAINTDNETEFRKKIKRNLRKKKIKGPYGHLHSFQIGGQQRVLKKSGWCPQKAGKCS